MANVKQMTSAFLNCNKLNEITCTTAFREWCWTNATKLSLPNAMKSGGGGNWILVD